MLLKELLSKKILNEAETVKFKDPETGKDQEITMDTARQYKSDIDSGDKSKEKAAAVKAAGLDKDTKDDKGAEEKPEPKKTKISANPFADKDGDKHTQDTADDANKKMDRDDLDAKFAKAEQDRDYAAETINDMDPNDMTEEDMQSLYDKVKSYTDWAGDEYDEMDEVQELIDDKDYETAFEVMEDLIDVDRKEKELGKTLDQMDQDDEEDPWEKQEEMNMANYDTEEAAEVLDEDEPEPDELFDLYDTLKKEIGVVEKLSDDDIGIDSRDMKQLEDTIVDYRDLRDSGQYDELGRKLDVIKNIYNRRKSIDFRTSKKSEKPKSTQEYEPVGSDDSYYAKQDVKDSMSDADWRRLSYGEMSDLIDKSMEKRGFKKIDGKWVKPKGGGIQRSGRYGTYESIISNLEEGVRGTTMRELLSKKILNETKTIKFKDPETGKDHEITMDTAKRYKSDIAAGDKSKEKKAAVKAAGLDKDDKGAKGKPKSKQKKISADPFATAMKAADDANAKMDADEAQTEEDNIIKTLSTKTRGSINYDNWEKFFEEPLEKQKAVKNRVDKIFNTLDKAEEDYYND